MSSNDVLDPHPEAVLASSKKCSLRRILRRVFWLGLMFSAGIVCGGAGTVMVITKVRAEASAHPELMGEHLTEMIRCDAGLNDAETEKIRAIVDAHHERLMVIHAEVFPKIVAELDGLETEVSAALTPAQRDQWLPRFRFFRKVFTP